MRKDLLWTEAKDIWYVNADPLWADFQGTPATAGRPIPFIDAFPVSLWLYKQEDLPNAGPGQGPKPPPLPKRNKTPSGPKKLENAKIHLLVHISQLVSVQLNHYQFLFLMRLLETVSEITTFLTHRNWKKWYPKNAKKIIICLNENLDFLFIYQPLELKIQP